MAATPPPAITKRASRSSGGPGGTSLNENLALRGSQRWLQLAVNRCPNVIDEAIAKAIGLEHGETVQWLSPLESDAFTEYKDDAFLDRLGIGPQYRRLEDFWPTRGPVWDGLARTSGGRYLLIEAKANIPEFDTCPTGASGGSLHKIRKALDETKGFLRVRSKTDWSECFYQYANRLAHLYFLRELNKSRCCAGLCLLCGRYDNLRQGPGIARRLAYRDRPRYPPSRRTSALPMDTR